MTRAHETTITMDPFVEILARASHSPDVHPEDDLYGFLIGSWQLDLVAYPDDGAVTHSTGEAHVARVLDGRAIQDVFINPQRSDRTPDSPKFGNWYGSTFREITPDSCRWRGERLEPDGKTWRLQVEFRAHRV